MKNKLLLFAAILLLASVFTSCRKTCRCYAYDGSVKEFDVDELNAQNISCGEMEQFDYGLRYSLCEKVF